MEAIAEGLWVLSEKYEKGGCIAQAVKCLEAICQSHVSFLPIVEVKTRLRIATLLLHHADNATHAKTHLERAQLLLKQIPACFELKLRAYSLLSRCYQLVGTNASVKQTLKKGLELSAQAGTGEAAQLWACNFNLQLAKALATESDYAGALRAVDAGLFLAGALKQPHLEMVFAAARVHVQLMQWDEPSELEDSIAQCDELFSCIPPHLRGSHVGLYIYKELLHTFYLLRCCDYKEAQDHVSELDRILRSISQPQAAEEPVDPAQVVEFRHQLEWLKLELQLPDIPQEREADLRYHYDVVQQKLIQCDQWRQAEALDKLPLGPAPLDEEWIPKGAVLVLVDLMAVICLRPKGMFKDCKERLISGMDRVNGELAKLGITNKVSETDLQHSAVWTGGVYLLLLQQLLENKAIVDLTCSDFVEAQQCLVQILDCYRRFPTMLRANESNIHMLLGHYSHSVGCFYESALHFMLAAKGTESQGLLAMCRVYAAVSYICIGDPDSSSQALDLIAPVYRNMDSYVGERERTLVLFASGLLQMKQHNLQEARTRLAAGLKLTHTELGNHQLVSQYLTVLGSLAIAMHDTSQACAILKSSFTLAKALHDIPTQVGILAELTVLFRVVGEPGKEAENAEAESKKLEDLRRRIGEAQASSSHMHLLQFEL